MSLHKGKVFVGRFVYFPPDSASPVLEIQGETGQETQPKEGWVQTPWGIRPYGWNARKETEYQLRRQ